MDGMSVEMKGFFKKHFIPFEHPTQRGSEHFRCHSPENYLRRAVHFRLRKRRKIQRFS
jgi:hypothetical protein